MLKKSLILTMLLIALQCIFISVASAQTTVDGDSANIDSAVTWDLADSPYIITTSVTVGTEGSLTIQPGVVVKFYKEAGLNVVGTLNAQGTVDKRIVFTDCRDDSYAGDSNNDGATTTPSEGWWGGIMVEGTANMDNCVVSYGGYNNKANIYKTGTGPLIITDSELSHSSYDGLLISNSDSSGTNSVNGCMFKDNKRYGINLDDIERDSYSGTGNSFSNNSRAPVCIEGGTLEHNITWNLEGSPYYIAGDVTVGQTAALDISPGVIVKFANNKGFVIEGTLTANGSSSDSSVIPGTSGQNTIYFTDYRDDTAGGDTNGDGAASKPNAGWWSGLKVSEAGAVTMKNCVIRYAGYYNESGIYKTGTGVLTLADVTISDSSNDGLLIGNEDSAAAVSVNDCTFKDNKRYGIHLYDIERDSYSGTGNSFSNNSRAPVCMEGGTLEHNITWNLEGSPYYIAGDVTVGQTAVLDINPGVIVKFANNKGFVIEGTLTANGSSSDSSVTPGTSDQNTIYFTDYRDDTAGGDTNGDGAASKPNAGWWSGLKVSEAGAVTMKNCVIRYAGYYNESGIYKTGTGVLTLADVTISDSSNDGLLIGNEDGAAAVSVNDCTFKNNKRYGTHLYDIERDSYSGTGNSFSNNSKAPICIEGGTLKHNVSWSSEGSPYYISGNVQVDDNAVLTIDPNVVVKFAQSVGLSVTGTLTAKGTPNGSGSTGMIYFTDYRDDSVGGDTNGDGAVSTFAPGWWNGINFGNAGKGTLDNCVVRGGGNYYESNIYKTGTGALSLTNSELCSSSANGLLIENNTGACTIAKNKIHSNKVGVSCEGVSPVIGGSSANANAIYHNTDLGVENKSGSILNAEYNWWGDATGPNYVTNPLGKGDKISDNVDFSNFLTSDPNSNPGIVTFDPQTNVAPTKNWTIKFSQDIFDGTSPNSSVNNQNITVSDDQGNPINVTLAQGNDLRSVIIQAPVGGYMSGKTYTITIKNIENTGKKIISKQYMMKFTIS